MFNLQRIFIFLKYLCICILLLCIFLTYIIFNYIETLFLKFRKAKLSKSNDNIIRTN